MSLSRTGHTGNALAGDLHQISALRNSASTDPRAAVKEASKQFEAIFMQQMLKGMRDANPGVMMKSKGQSPGPEAGIDHRCRFPMRPQ